MLSTISIIGLGKLGAPIAACFAASGFQTIAVDIDAQKTDAIGRGVPPVHEPGLAELLQESQGRLLATKDTESGHPRFRGHVHRCGHSKRSGRRVFTSYVIATCEAIGRALRNKDSYHLIVLTSTVMPGSTGGEIKSALERASGKRCGQDFGLCYSPEFIALGTVIRDFYYPDFLLVGESDPRAGDLLSDIYVRTCKNSPSIARMNFINAEITKLAVNTYITTKISYANMLARLCEKLPEADVSVVTYALGLDSRIGSKYLKGAVSYGGPCFPRDNRAFAALPRVAAAFSDLAEATDRFNRAQVAASCRTCEIPSVPESFPSAFLGLTYKPDTDVIEESFGLLLTLELASANLPIVVFDPSADLPRVFAAHKSVRMAASAEGLASRNPASSSWLLPGSSSAILPARPGCSRFVRARAFMLLGA